MIKAEILKDNKSKYICVQDLRNHIDKKIIKILSLPDEDMLPEERTTIGTLEKLSKELKEIMDMQGGNYGMCYA